MKLTKAELKEIIYCLSISGTTTMKNSNGAYDYKLKLALIKKLETTNS